MSAITTHILDTSIGKPAAGVKVKLEFLDHGEWRKVGGGSTDSDGRVKDLINEDFSFSTGQYRIEFVVSDYFKAQNTESFYPYVRIVFVVKDTDNHYHVPLLLNPYGYSTYRGS
ncbi:MAG: hydroxyisourate hydrolase [Vulcanimicrobiota bacterium]